jgi:hypothetical protein
MMSTSEFEFQPHESVHNHPFTIVYNQLIESNISPEAFRLITYMCSKPKSWKFHDYKLREVCQCGESKLKQVVKELREAGYVQTVSIPSGLADGKFKGSKRLFSGHPIFKNTDRLDFNPSVTDRLIHRQVDLPTVGESTPQVSNTERLNNTKRTTTDARAQGFHPYRENPDMENPPPPAAKAFVAAVVLGEKEKNGQFTYMSESEDLIQEMGKIDITHQRAVLLLGKYGNIRIREVINMTNEKAKTNPQGYFERALINDWKPSTGKGVQDAPKGATRAIQIDEEARKAKEAWDAGEKRIEAIRANPEVMESRISGLRNAMKQARASASAH